MTVLMVWSYRRIRQQMMFWWQFMRLVVDWTVVVYFLVPGVALAAYEGYRYYDGAVLVGVSPQTLVLGPISLPVCMTFLCGLMILFIHFSTFGKPSFPMQYGDRVFVLLAPVRRDRLFGVLFIEMLLSSTIYFAAVTVLVLPLLSALDIHAEQWLTRFAILTVYVSAVRVIGILIRQSDNIRFREWFAYQAARILLLVPPMIAVASVFLSHTWTFVWGFFALTAIATVVTWRMQQRLSWDPMYRNMGSRLIGTVLSVQTTSSTTTFAMRVPSRLLVRIFSSFSAQFRHRPLHPVLWLSLLRIPRKRGVFWQYLRMWSISLLAIEFIRVDWVRFVIAILFLAILYQYWKSALAPLYLVPSKEQSVASRFALEAAGTRIVLIIMLCNALLWGVVLFLLY